MSNSDEQLLSVLAKLGECQAALRQAGNHETAQLVSVAILDLRMKLHRIGEAELKALCEAVMRSDTGDEGLRDEGSQRRPLLRVVK